MTFNHNSYTANKPLETHDYSKVGLIKVEVEERGKDRQEIL